MARKRSNAVKYPEAWAFYKEHARNISEEPHLNHLGNYRIPEPNQSGDFIYADTVEDLWISFLRKWYEPNIKSESLYGKIQYIVEHF